MKGDQPLAKIAMLEASLRCFVCGLIGLVPLIGFPMALLALMSFRRACAGHRGLWNAARPYLIWGFVFGAIGVLSSLGLFGIFLLAVLTGQFQ